METKKKWPLKKPRRYQDQRGYYLNLKYKLSAADYDRMLEEQGSRCGICYIHQDSLNQNLCVDHCHKTQKIRGLLCQNCNTALGRFSDSEILLRSALEYLRR